MSPPRVVMMISSVLGVDDPKLMEEFVNNQTTIFTLSLRYCTDRKRCKNSDGTALNRILAPLCLVHSPSYSHIPTTFGQLSSKTEGVFPRHTKCIIIRYVNHAKHHSLPLLVVFWLLNNISKCYNRYVVLIEPIHCNNSRVKCINQYKQQKKYTQVLHSWVRQSVLIIICACLKSLCQNLPHGSHRGPVIVATKNL